MVDFELKIFANPSGFKELQLNNTQELFTPDIVLLRAYDAERDTFKTGAYSVFFTPACYIVSYQFDVPNEVNFRGATAILAIAIRRGKKINNITSLFTDLRGKVNRSLVEVGHTSIHIKLNEFNEMIQQSMQDDFDQLFVNSAVTTNIKRALVGYESAEQLKHLLEVPNRRKFDGYNLVFFVPLLEARNIWESIKNKYDAIPFGDSEFEYKTSYEVVYPDGHTEFVSSRESEINYTTHKPYYQNLPFIGKLADNWEHWQIRPSDDKTQFIIGVKLEPDKLIFNVRLLDGDGNLLPENIVLKSNIGTYISYSHELTLIGDEVGNQSSVRLNPEAANRKIVSQKWDGDIYYVHFAKVYNYDFTSILRRVKQQSGENGFISLYSSDRAFLASFTYQCPTRILETPFENTYFVIRETQKTEEKTGFLQSDGRFREDVTLIQKKPKNHGIMPSNPDARLKVTFKVEDLQIAKKGLRLILECTEGGVTKCTPYKSNEAIIRNFSRRNSTSMSYTVTMKGYKPISGTVFFDNVGDTIEIPLNFELTREAKRARQVIILLSSFLLLFFSGFCTGWFTSPRPSGEDLDDADTIVKKSVYHELTQKLQQGKTTTVDIEHNDTVNSDSTNGTNVSPADTLKTCLEGLNFKRTDIEAYKKIKGYDTKLVTDCNACFSIINARIQDKSNQDVLNNHYNNIKITNHQQAIERMLTGDLNKSYTSTDTKSAETFNSIKATIKNLENNQKPQ